MSKKKSGQKEKQLSSISRLFPSHHLPPHLLPLLFRPSLLALGEMSFSIQRALFLCQATPSNDDRSTLLQLLVDGQFTLPGNRFSPSFLANQQVILLDVTESNSISRKYYGIWEAHSCRCVKAGFLLFFFSSANQPFHHYGYLLSSKRQ